MPLVEVGKHLLTCTATAFNKASTGNPQVVLEFTDEETGASIKAYLSCADNALPFTASKLAAAGWDPEGYDYDFSLLNREDCALIGMREIPVEVVEETYNGKATRKVGWIGVGAATEKMPEDEAKAAAADIRKKLIALKGGAPKPNAGRSEPPAKKVAAGGKKTTW